MKNLKDYTQKQIIDGFNDVLHDNDVWPRYKQYFDNKVNNETYDNRVEFMRTGFNMGAPLNINGTRYKNVKDRQKEQEKYTEDFVNVTDLAI